MPYSMTIDLHGFTVNGAKDMLNLKLKNLPKDTREVVVIHGFHQGTALREMVRSYNNPIIERKYLGLNQGETVFMIKPRR